MEPTTTTADQAARVCDQIEATGALGLVRDRALRMVAAAKSTLTSFITPSARWSSSTRLHS